MADTGSKKEKGGFSAEERAAMRERTRELKAAATKEEEEKAAVAAIDELSEPERTWFRKIHAIIKKNAPVLSPKTWYGMPAYSRDGNVICFLQSKEKFKARYATLGFNNFAQLDDGAMWPVAYALIDMTPAVEAKITELIKKSVGQ